MLPFHSKQFCLTECPHLNVLLHEPQPTVLELKVVQQPHGLSRRLAVLQLLGSAFHEAFRFSDQLRLSLPRPLQLNLVIGIGALGYFLEKTASATPNRIIFRVSKQWPSIPSTSNRPHPAALQFRTVWFDNKFYKSIFDGVAETFQWVELVDPSVQTIRRLKLSQQCRMGPLGPVWPQFCRLRPETPVYVEYQHRDQYPVSFFGTVHDLRGRLKQLDGPTTRRFWNMQINLWPLMKHKIYRHLLRQCTPQLPRLTLSDLESLPEDVVRALPSFYTYDQWLKLTDGRPLTQQYQPTEHFQPARLCSTDDYRKAILLSTLVQKQLRV